MLRRLMARPHCTRGICASCEDSKRTISPHLSPFAGAVVSAPRYGSFRPLCWHRRLLPRCADLRPALRGRELEPRFVALGQQNLDLWRQRYGFTGGTIVQGDSRRLRAVLAGAQVQAVVGSPPYIESLNSAQHGIRDESRAKDSTDIQQACYGTTPGQLGAMPPGVVVGSPPYAESLNSAQNGIDCQKSIVPGGTRMSRGVPTWDELWHHARPTWRDAPGCACLLPPLRRCRRGPRHAQRHRLVQGAGGWQGGNPGTPGQWRGVWHQRRPTWRDAAWSCGE